MALKGSTSKAKTELPKIRDYQLTAPLTNKGAGNGLWGFAVKDGREYFIKQFLSALLFSIIVLATLRLVYPTMVGLPLEALYRTLITH